MLKPCDRYCVLILRVGCLDKLVSPRPCLDREFCPNIEGWPGLRSVKLERLIEYLLELAEVFSVKNLVFSVLFYRRILV